VLSRMYMVCAGIESVTAKSYAIPCPEFA
jgi:hypothetical protein